VYGDSGLAAERRDAFAAAHAGRAGAAPGPWERLRPDQMRRDPAALDTAMRARGLLDDWRCVLVEEAADALAGAIGAAIDLADAQVALIVEAGSLRAGSKLRKLFEAHPSAAALPCWPSPPSAAEIAERLKAAGVAAIAPEASAALLEMGAAMDRGAFWGEIDKLALYAAGRAGPVTAADVAACGPRDFGSDVDSALDALAQRDPAALRRALARLEAQGVGSEAILALALRRFRTLLEAWAVMQAQGCDAETALGRLSPPIRFPRSKPLARQLSAWRGPALDRGFQILREAQAAQRGAASVAGRAMVERAMLRVALGGR
jgi:DNA polymerase-3 subunit delta